MKTPLAFDVILVFIGVFILIVGFINRDKKWGPFVLWIGLVSMLGVGVYHVFETLG